MRIKKEKKNRARRHIEGMKNFRVNFIIIKQLLNSEDILKLLKVSLQKIITFFSFLTPRIRVKKKSLKRTRFFFLRMSSVIMQKIAGNCTFKKKEEEKNFLK